MEETRKFIFELLKQAVRSPSADNCQPWVFDVQENQLLISADPVRIQHVLDAGGFASLLSLGALIETIEQLAAPHGYEAKIAFLFDLPLPQGGAPWCKLLFTEKLGGERGKSARREGASKETAALNERCTDRRRFHGYDEATLKQVVGDVSSAEFAKLPGGVAAHALVDLSDQLTQGLMNGEAILFEIDGAVQSTAKWIRVSQKEVARTRDGFPIKNLGVSLHEAILFMTVGQYRILGKVLRPLLKFVMRGKTKSYLRGSALVGFSSTEISAPSLVNVGRLAMRTWLKLTVAQYGVQPMSLSSLGSIMCKYGHFHALAPSAASDFAQAEKALKESFRLGQDKSVVWLFRVGKTLTPLPADARTLRLPPVLKA